MSGVQVDSKPAIWSFLKASVVLVRYMSEFGLILLNSLLASVVLVRYMST